MNPFRSMSLMISRMPPAVMLTAIVGLAVGVTFAVTSNLDETKKKYDDETNKLIAKNTAKGTVVYLIKDVPEGQTIPSESLEERQIELQKMPIDSITSASLAAGRITKYGLATGQLLSKHDLQPQGISLGFEARLKPGMRAVTFAVDSNSGVAGFVSPESHVDIIGMVGSGPETKARPILSDVEVIAVGQSYQKGPGSNASPASSVTVAVNPDDTQKLIKSIVAGKLYLSLRNNTDHTPVATVDITQMFPKPPGPSRDLTTLVTLPTPPIPPLPDGDLRSSSTLGVNSIATPPPKPPHEIEAWAGSRKDVLTVPEH